MADPNYKAKSQKYQTPKDIYSRILFFIGREKFDYDVCASEDNIPASFYYSEEKNGLKQLWFGINFLNPPWKFTRTWLKYAFKQVIQNNCEVWCIIPGDRMNNKFFKDLLTENKNWFGVFLQGKYNFYNPEVTEEENKQNESNGGLNSPVLLLYLGKNAREYEKRWRNEEPIAGIPFS